MSTFLCLKFIRDMTFQRSLLAVVVCVCALGGGLSARAENILLVLSMPDEARVHFQQPTQPLAYMRFLIACKAAGVEIELVFNPGLRSLALANTGEVDGLFARPATIEERYEDLVRVASPVTHSRPAVYGFKLLNWREDEIPVMIALRGSATFYRAFSGLRKSEQLLQMNSIEQALKFLKAGRAGALMTAASQMSYYQQFNKSLTEGLLELPPRLPSEPLYSYLHKRHGYLAERIAEELARLPEDKGR